MAFPSALFFLPALDVVVLRLLQWICPLTGLQEPLLAVWIVGLARFIFLLKAVHVLSTCLPEWLQKQLILFTGTLSLLIPCYVTASTAIRSSAAHECLHGWMRWDVITLCYLISLVVSLIYHHFSPFGEEEEEKKHAASLGRLFSCMQPELCRFLIIALFVVISCMSEMVMPYYTGRMTDWIGNEKDSSAFDNAIRAMAIITTVSAVLEFLCDIFFYFTMSIIHMRIQGQIFWAILKQEIAFFDSVPTGVITSRITTDTNTMSESLTEQLSWLMWYSMRVFFLYVFMLFVSWRLALFTLIWLPVIIVIPKLTGTFYQNLAVQVQESLSEANQVALETFSNMKTVRSFANEDGDAERYMEKLQDTYQLNKKEAAAYTGYMWTNNFSGLALKVAILYYGGRMVTSGMVSEGDLVAFVLYELQFTDAVAALLKTYPDMKRTVGASEKIFEYIDSAPKVLFPGTLAPETLHGRVTFDNVTFCYPSRPDTAVLKGVSFKLNPGEVTALVGPSSSGKSSCVSLLERFYEPQCGRILIDGIPLKEYEHQYLHNKMALVNQEPVLFARSVQENISYGLGGRPLDAVKKVAREANAHEFITSLKDGYNTGAGERGGQLSGGEKQRVAIARALMRDPQILILDDATSALDTESEHLVQNTIYSGTRQRTVLVIAHRLSMVEQANKIIVLEEGEIKEQGTHQELLEKKGSYWRLVEKQRRGVTEDRR